MSSVFFDSKDACVSRAKFIEIDQDLMKLMLKCSLLSLYGGNSVSGES